MLGSAGSAKAGGATFPCDDEGGYDDCMVGVNAAYNYCMTQNPGDPQGEWIGGYTYGEASCWAEYCLVLPEPPDPPELG